MGRLTEPRLQELLHAGKPVVVAVGDGTGLSFRISKTDSGLSASWQLRYRHAGKAHWSTLGRYPNISLKEAKKRATKERAAIGEGMDPVAERRRSRLALKAAKTFRELAEDYVDRALPDLAQSTQADVGRYLTKDVLPRIGHLRIEDITGGEIVHMVEKIGKRSAVVARRAFTITSVICGHGMAKHLAQSNPCASIGLKAILGKQQPVFRLVSLTEQQLRAVLPRLPEVGRANALAVKVLLATCARKGELIHARWEHLDLDLSVWNIPAELSKNGKPFTIPLPEVVVGWFRELRELSRGSQWVVPGQNQRDPVSDSTLNAALYRLDDTLPRFTGP